MKLTERAHREWESFVRSGDWVIDATAGNGWDTLFLAKKVGPCGRVLAVDMQKEALAETRRRLESEGVLERVLLVEGNHRNLNAFLPDAWAGCVRLGVFNLGYLPGGDHGKITQPESTLAALDRVWEVLRPGGGLSVLVYHTHPGGAEELRAVVGWREAKAGDCRHLEWTEGESPHAPKWLWAIKK